MTDQNGLPQVRCLLAGGDVTLERTPERLVALGFRHWMTGFQTGDSAHWQKAATMYERELGVCAARLAISQLSAWVSAVKACARRTISVNPGCHGCFCRDECLAVAMVAACQHDTCPALRACTFALVESDLLADVTVQTESYSTVMRSLGLILAPQSARIGAFGGGVPRSLLN